MNLLLAIYFFIIGTVFGSFYNVVGYRLPRNQSLIRPKSHCTNCNHELKPWELIPIFSFLIQGGKCRNCKQKISWFYTIFEFITGILFMFSYLKYGFTYDLMIALLFVSMSIIIIISDYQTLTIPDEVLIFFGLSLLIIIFLKSGINAALIAILNGAISFIIMFLIKKMGDFIFKKESMGGGDIKLMFVFGIMLGYELSIVSIFLGSIIGLPISLIILKFKKTNIIPFGPFLCIGALILFFSGISFKGIIDYLV